MARIRTVKPEFFRHYELYRAEIEERMPMRIAFAGLWTSADREGRFRWVPDELKLDCLPYDKIDFSRVLDALTTRGFIVKYTSMGRDYGWIPGFLRHQVINNRERDSELPEPPAESVTLTRDPRVTDACPTESSSCKAEGKGKEGKGKRVGDACPPPDPFSIGSHLKEWASTEAPEVDLVRETAKFLDHHRSVGSKFRDWDAAWRKWMRNAAEWSSARKNNGRGGPATKPDIFTRLEAQADEEEKRAAKQVSH
jgi:hypothetical protein